MTLPNMYSFLNVCSIKWQYLCDFMCAFKKHWGLVIWDRFFEGRMENCMAWERDRKKKGMVFSVCSFAPSLQVCFTVCKINFTIYFLSLSCVLQFYILPSKCHSQMTNPQCFEMHAWRHAGLTTLGCMHLKNYTCILLWLIRICC